MPRQTAPSLAPSLTPFSRSYWSLALRDMKNPRVLVFSALMIAACVALSYVPSLPIGDKVRVTWGFLARSLCALVGGPLNALVFGAAEDTITFLIHPTGPYFPGYMLTTMLGTFLYALFLYRADVTPLRVFFAKLLTNVLNVTLGALWSAILYGKGYLYYASTSLVKNAVMLPVQTVALCALFAALMPILQSMGLIQHRFLPWKTPRWLTKSRD